jgi:hypothetical protein
LNVSNSWGIDKGADFALGIFFKKGCFLKVGFSIDKTTRKNHCSNSN